MKNAPLVLSVICTLLFVGCKRQEIARELREFRSSEVILPDGMQKVYARNISEFCGEEKLVTLVNYYDSTECSSCRIAHLTDLIELYELEDRYPEFQVLTIFSPSEDKYDEVMAELMRSDPPCPVYVDFCGEFRKSNPQIPSDARFHSFLLDRHMKPVFAGNPAASHEMRELFMKVLENMFCNGGEYKEPHCK